MLISYDGSMHGSAWASPLLLCLQGEERARRIEELVQRVKELEVRGCMW